MPYWYQPEPHTPLPPLPPPEARRLPAVVIPLAAIPVDSLHWQRRGATSVVAFPVPRPDRYTIVVYPVGGPDSDRATFRVAGSPSRTALLVADDSNTLLPAIPLGAVSVRDSVRLEVRSRHLPAAIEALPLHLWATEWHVVGPFPSPRVPGKETSPALDSVLAPERNPDLAGSYAGVSGQPIRWRRVSAGPGGRVRLTRIFQPAEWVLAYGETLLYSPDRKSTRLNSSHSQISYAVFCLKKKKTHTVHIPS